MEKLIGIGVLLLLVYFVTYVALNVKKTKYTSEEEIIDELNRK